MMFQPTLQTTSSRNGPLSHATTGMNPLEHDAQWKRPVTNGHRVYDSTYIVCPERQIHRDSKYISDWPWASLVAQTVKSLPAVQENQVWSLGREDPLEKEMATHSSNLAWRISWIERSLACYSPWGRKESDTTERLHFYVLTSGHNAGDTHTHTHRVLRHARKWMPVWEDMNHIHENLEKILLVTAIFVIAWWGTTANKTMKFLLTVYWGQCGKAVCPAGHPGVSLWFSSVWL